MEQADDLDFCNCFKCKTNTRLHVSMEWTMQHATSMPEQLLAVKPDRLACASGS